MAKRRRSSRRAAAGEVHQEIERLLADAGGAFGATPVPVYLDHPVLDGLAAMARATSGHPD